MGRAGGGDQLQKRVERSSLTFAEPPAALALAAAFTPAVATFAAPLLVLGPVPGAG